MILRRVSLIIFIVYAIIAMVYGMMALVPGKAFIGERAVASEELMQEKIRQYEEKHNFTRYITNFITVDFDRPAAEIIQFNLGTSYVHKERPITDIISPAIGPSFALGGLTVLLALMVGIPAGIVSAQYQNAWQDRMAMFLALIGLSIPAFVLGPLLQLVFALEMDWLPISKWWQPFGEYASGSFANVVLPSITLAAIPAATIARLTRSSMLEALNQDYIKTALAKGLTRFQATLRHGLKNAVLPVLSYLGPASAAILSGSIVVERIFDIPGLGRHMIDGATTRDIELVLGTVILYCVLLLVFNLIIDVLYGVFDPRIKDAQQ